MLRLSCRQTLHDLHLEPGVEIEVNDPSTHRLRKPRTNFPEKLNTLKTIDDGLGNQIPRHYFRLFKPTWRPWEDRLIGLVEFLTPRKKTHRVRDILPSFGHQLEREAIRIGRIIITHPLQRLLNDLKLSSIQVDQPTSDRFLTKHSIEESTGFLLVKIQSGHPILAVETEEMLPQNLARSINPQCRIPIKIQKTLNLLLLPQRIPLSTFLTCLYTSFIDC